MEADLFVFFNGFGEKSSKVGESNMIAKHKKLSRCPAQVQWLTMALLFIGIVLVVSTPGVAADTPVPTQGVGEHSTLCTSDGDIRDDKLADDICAFILLHGVDPHDVKIFFNSCYGGGMLDDFQRVFGPGGGCEGIPWVAGSASTAGECAEGWPDDYINNGHPTAGSCWTDALSGAVPAGGNVKDTLGAAEQGDDSGPNHDDHEHPVTGSGNGGDGITWNGAGKHEAVVFGGDQTDQRHHNNVDNMEGALDNVWGTDPHNINKLDGGTTSDLLDALAAAVAALDADTQLVLYFDDHGDTEFDLKEYLQSLGEWLEFYIVTPSAPLITTFELHPGWVQGLAGNVAQGDAAEPTLNLSLANTISNGGDWSIILNGSPIPIPPGPQTGNLQLAVVWTTIQTGPNQLVIAAAGPTTDQMVLQGLELSSGKINEVEKPPCGSHLHADSNCDGAVNELDIGPFVQALLDRTSWESGHSCDFICANDCSDDGEVNGADVQSFVNAIIGG